MIWGFGRKADEKKQEQGGLDRLFAGLAKSSARLGEGLAGLTKSKLDASALE